MVAVFDDVERAVAQFIRVVGARVAARANVANFDFGVRAERFPFFHMSHDVNGVAHRTPSLYLVPLQDRGASSHTCQLSSLTRLKESTFQRGD